MVEQVLPTSRPLDAFLGRGLALRIKIGRQSEAVLTDCGFFVSYAKACGVYRMWKPVKVLETGCLGRCIFSRECQECFCCDHSCRPCDYLGTSSWSTVDGEDRLGVFIVSVMQLGFRVCAPNTDPAVAYLLDS